MMFLIVISMALLLALSVIAKSDKQELEDNIKNKIHKDLWEEIDKTKKEPEKENVITILIEVNTSDKRSIKELAKEIGKSSIKIEGVYTLGDIIIAEVDVNKIKDIAKIDDIKSVWPDRKYYATLESSVPQIHAEEMWAKGFNGSGVKIAILDTGVDSSHPIFNGRVINEAVFTGENSTQDGHGHGTHCAGIAAGNGDIKGVAPGALLMNGKVLSDLGEGSDSSIIAGINWAVNPDGNSSTEDGAEVISMSLGGSYVDLDSPIVLL
ncbi:MAG: S8 family serine peptidase [Nanoarchaeota archaeon]|nr:S8 family serine peptidase [Nanoarchaeota archaeon]